MTDPTFAALLRETMPNVGSYTTPLYWENAARVLESRGVRLGHVRAEAAPPRRDPGVDWPAVERLVDAAIRREEITSSRGAEILGLRLTTWRERALEIAAEDGAPTPEPEAK